jgi:hypothetical protein
MDFWEVTCDDLRMRENRVFSIIKFYYYVALDFILVYREWRLTHKRKSQHCHEKEIYLVPRCLEILERYCRIFEEFYC